jgi:hypothetical protein
MEDHNFFFNFFMNNKLVTAVLCFGSHICNQAGRLGLTNLDANGVVQWVTQLQ